MVVVEEELALLANPQQPDHFDRYRHISTYAPPYLTDRGRLLEKLDR